MLCGILYGAGGMCRSSRRNVSIYFVYPYTHCHQVSTGINLGGLMDGICKQSLLDDARFYWSAIC